MINKLIYRIGLNNLKFRHYYSKYTNGKWHWGLIQYISDPPIYKNNWTNLYIEKSLEFIEDMWSIEHKFFFGSDNAINFLERIRDE